MERAAELLKRAQGTLEKYRKNKTLVSPADLAGKYKVPFQKLKAQLAGELSDYLKAYSLERLQITEDEYFQEFADTVNRIFKDAEIGKRVGRAAFKEYDIEQVEQMAEELRIRIFKEAYTPYFQRHICLYASADCFFGENPHIPRFYNTLVDKFFDGATGKWISDEAAQKTAILICIQGGNHDQK